MLLELKVSQFAIIDNLHIRFGEGLNILSGETGAGKSVLLKSLSLLMGLKGSVESIRSGHDQASIEGVFDLSQRKDLLQRMKDLSLPIEDHILLVRRVLSEGKSRVYLNGVPSTLNTLRDLVAPLIEVAGATAPLIEMTGQFDNRNLISKAYHLDLIDQFSGLWPLRQSAQEAFEAWREVLQERDLLLSDSSDLAQRLDFLRFQRDEIDQLNLQARDDENIESELKRLKSLGRLIGFVSLVEQTLNEEESPVLDRLRQLSVKAMELKTLDPLLTEKAQGLETARALLEDSLYELHRHVSRMEADPSRMDELEARLSAIRKLQKKFGPDLASVLKKREEMDAEIARLENRDQHLAQLEIAARDLEQKLRKIALELHHQRAEKATALTAKVNSELKDLNMKGVQFHASVTLKDQLSASGLSEVEFQTQSAPDFEPRPLSKAASGGELSRILLSLKKIVGSGPHPRTFLFDEVDTGVSGPTAEKVGRKLRSISKNQQVICVTHLPQVAAWANVHFHIHKSVSKSEGAAMEVTRLDSKARVQEIARLISGEKITKTSLAHAEELLKESKSL